jgi:hypothetical protein
MAFIELSYDCQNAEKNSNEELIQRCAWRLVRSAQDKMGDEKGAEKRVWAIEQLKKEFPDLNEKAEHYIRAAYMNFKTETRYAA